MGPVKVNITVIAATNRNLRDMVARGEFRSDLYWRLARYCEVVVPSLTDRPRDVWAFAEAVRRREEPSKAFAPDVRKVLIGHNWSDQVLGGNLRQLERAVCHAILEADIEGADMIYAEHFGLRVARADEARRPAANDDQDEEAIILAVVREAGDRGAARRDVAQALGCSPRTAGRRLRELVGAGVLRHVGQRYQLDSRV